MENKTLNYTYKFIYDNEFNCEWTIMEVLNDDFKRLWTLKQLQKHHSEMPFYAQSHMQTKEYVLQNYPELLL